MVGSPLVFDRQTGSCACFRPSLELADLLVCCLMPQLLPGPAARKLSDTACPCRTAASSASWPTPSMMSGETCAYNTLLACLCLHPACICLCPACPAGHRCFCLRPPAGSCHSGLPGPHHCLQLAPSSTSHHPNCDLLNNTDCPESPCRQPLTPGCPAAHHLRLSDASEPCSSHAWQGSRASPACKPPLYMACCTAGWPGMLMHQSPAAATVGRAAGPPQHASPHCTWPAALQGGQGC